MSELRGRQGLPHEGPGRAGAHHRRGAVAATVYDCDRLRCNLCGEVYTAPAPEGVGNDKYDATATSMVGLLKYGAGLPFNRIEKLQDGMGIPLPASDAMGSGAGGGENAQLPRTRRC